MHFDFTISLASIFSFSTLVLAARIYRKWILMEEQNAMMWRDYKKRHGINGNWREHPDYQSLERPH